MGNQEHFRVWRGDGPRGGRQCRPGDEQVLPSVLIDVLL
jgi:hypothetical protein